MVKLGERRDMRTCDRYLSPHLQIRHFPPRGRECFLFLTSIDAVPVSSSKNEYMPVVAGIIGV